ncbi:hypothetical protein [Sulfidibacter corallicola]|uniref:Uncharacterized protein n=1 Tax=Sulfidibacter corallicola TaxID=2818388 RepID=A0A8A4TL18_SULCO|nr:hypothetical protein [Sulfidibacter corallicola]QTD50167.1 hypothetical protein J3U87_31670 [Sulfidibacter corallicola]
MLNELVKNSIVNMQRTVEDMSSRKNQEAYKANVAFVHVPTELLEQWSDHYRRVKEKEWFGSLFLENEINDIDLVHHSVMRFRESIGQEVPDVPLIFQEPSWQTVIESAEILLKSLEKIQVRFGLK